MFLIAPASTNAQLSWGNLFSPGHGQYTLWPMSGPTVTTCHSLTQATCETNTDLLCFWQANAGVCTEGPPYNCALVSTARCTIGQTSGKCHLGSNNKCTNYVACADYSSTNKTACEHASCSWIPLHSPTVQWICNAVSDEIVFLDTDTTWTSQCEIHQRCGSFKQWRCGTNCFKTYPTHFVSCVEVTTANLGVCVSQKFTPPPVTTCPTCHNTTVTVVSYLPLKCSSLTSSTACNSQSASQCIWANNVCVTHIPPCSTITTSSVCAANSGVCSWVSNACVPKPPPAPPVCHNTTVIVTVPGQPEKCHNTTITLTKLIECSGLVTEAQCQTTGINDCLWFTNQCVPRIKTCSDCISETECSANSPICTLNPISGTCGPTPTRPCQNITIPIPTPIVCSSFVRNATCVISGRGQCQWFNQICVDLIKPCSQLSSAGCLANSNMCHWNGHGCVPIPPPVCHNTTVTVDVLVPTPIVCSTFSNEVTCNFQTSGECLWSGVCCVDKLLPCSSLVTSDSCHSNAPMCVWNSVTWTCSPTPPSQATCHNTTTIVTIQVDIPVPVPTPVVCSFLTTSSECLTEGMGVCVWDSTCCIDIILPCSSAATQTACNANAPTCYWNTHTNTCTPPPQICPTCPTCHNTTILVPVVCNAITNQELCTGECIWAMNTCVDYLLPCSSLLTPYACMANGDLCVWQNMQETCAPIPIICPHCTNTTVIVTVDVPIPLVCKHLTTQTNCQVQGANQCIWFNNCCVDDLETCPQLTTADACLANSDLCVWVNNLCIPIPPVLPPPCHNTTVTVFVPIPIPTPIVCNTYVTHDTCVCAANVGECAWYGDTCVDLIQTCASLTSFDACVANAGECSWVNNACQTTQPPCHNDTVIVRIPTPIICSTFLTQEDCNTLCDGQCIWFNNQCVTQIEPCSALTTQEECNANGVICDWNSTQNNCDVTINLTCDQLTNRFDDQCACPTIEWP